MAAGKTLLLAAVCGLLGAGLAQVDWADQLSNEMDPARIEEFLRILTEKPHLAGTQEGYSLAEYVRQTWEDQGLDSAHMAPYDVLLSYPDPDNPSYVALVDENSTEVFRSSPGEPHVDVDPAANISSVVPPFAAYSPSGVVESSRLVYVNYGRTSDFDLVKSRGINVKRKMVIARYGKTSRGRKLRRAQDRGAVGMIVYSDPREVVGIGWGRDRKYPDGWYAPGTAVQRGHFLYTTGEGEPLTPGYPAKDYTYIMEESESDQLPTIPVHVIGYTDAMEIMKLMRGREVVNDSWRGLLETKYRYGAGFGRPKLSSARKIRLNVTVTKEKRTIHNVVGIIRGAVEPDRYVVLGNHRDAWNLGAVDPNSGTACLLEITRALGEMMKQGWRPRRTLMFISWDAEEHGMHGSHEWIEEFGKIMSDRAVAYINVDIAVRDKYTLRARATPSLKPLLKEAAMKVPWPETTPDGDTLYSVWRQRTPADSEDPDSDPKISLPSSASDFVPFVRRVGVPIMDLAMVHRYTITYPNYPLYHTAYETFHLQKTYIDPEFKFHRLMSQLWAGIAFSLAEAEILPIDVSEYAATVSEMFDVLKDEYGEGFQATQISLDALESAVTNFTQAAAMFEEKLASLGNDTSPMVARMYNDQLMQMERAFIDPLGIPSRPFYRHTVLSNGLYSTDTFPALGDAVERMGSDWTDPGKASKLRDVRKQLSIISHFIQSAANTLGTPASTVF
ncbi:PREDICTED: glutamate carboxypeptidase 2-like [Branchiostoma belcheri]|uniref:Glutamate carboxypeptidase 2 n=1 Tax=Branchiostoma belcheri TaxID=7741 RepID=A0A6P4Z944_BRABE|nr:PREDICTED: glutamate carboxypeptidase 2-like [Branchiostoma belcheri]